MPLPPLDTSGGNVTYACLSLAGQLGARRITVDGADFSYPLGNAYARGTYFYPLFERRQNRLSPLEAGVSSFLYRSPFLPPENEGTRGRVSPCYETSSLRFYRKSFEEKASSMEAEVSAESGLGIPLDIRKKTDKPFNSGIINFIPGKALMDSREFLAQYAKDIKALPVSGHEMNPVFTTLLPLIAAIKHRQQELSKCDLIEAVESGDPGAVLDRAESDSSRCSAGAVLGALGYASAINAGPARLLEYSTSADATTEIPDSFVGYAAFQITDNR
jgi:hypothetical protein